MSPACQVPAPPRKARATKRPAARLSRWTGRQLVCERLEDRNLLAIVTWIGSSLNPIWSSASNWRDDAGVHRLPGAADDVVIGPTAGYTVTHDAADADTVQSLTLSGKLSIGAGSLAVEALTVPGHLTLRVGGTLTLVTDDSTSVV